MRINKFLSECGICSRREADRLVQAGHVSVNGKPALMGMDVSDADDVCVDGRAVHRQVTKTYLRFYKPKGIVCTFEASEPHNLRKCLESLDVRVTYAGRLDRNSEGLMILTDDGDLIDRMMRARNGHEKEYEVTADRPVTEAFLIKIQKGVYLEELGVTTRPCRAWQTGERSFHIVLTQGLNRQIRRMCAVCGYKVSELKRVRIVNVLLGDMKPGEIQPLTDAERRELLSRTAEADHRSARSLHYTEQH